MKKGDKKEEKLQLDAFEDCIFLMDERQLEANRRLFSSRRGVLQQHEWTILMMPTVGSIDLEIGGEPYHCRVGQVVVCLLSDGIVMRRMTDDFAARTIGMSFEFTNGLNVGDTLGSSLAVRRRPVQDINRQAYSSIITIFDMLRGIIDAVDNPYRFHAVQLMVETFYYTIGYYLRQGADTLKRTGGESLTDQFLRLVRRDFKQHRDLDYYADAICVSKKHLSATVSRTTGQSASHWVERSVVLWAKQQLEHSALTVGQIAAELHFNNQSHFGTYFKRATGQSPETFRQDKKRKN